MQEFEKWNIEHPVDSRYRDTPINQFKAFIEEEREIVWRAALKWVDSKTRGGYWVNPVEGIIDKELGDK